MAKTTSIIPVMTTFQSIMAFVLYNTNAAANDINSLFTATSSLTQTTQTASYTLALSDATSLIDMNSASAVNVTIPTNATVAFPLGTVIEICQYGAGQVTLVAAGGVTTHTPSSLTTRAQYSTISIRQRTANEWIVSGDVT